MGVTLLRHVVGCLSGGELCGFIVMSKKEFIFLKFVEQIHVVSWFSISNLTSKVLLEDFLERRTVLVLCSVCK